MYPAFVRDTFWHFFKQMFGNSAHELKRKSSAFLLAFVGLLLVFHFLATMYFWYWQMPWFDLPMHFAGGAFVGFSALYLYYHSGYMTSRHHGKIFPFILAISCAAIVGILWECFEYLVYVKIKLPELSFLFLPTVPDTLADLLLDIVGGIFAGGAFQLLWRGN